jgi:hypothetical protein
MGEIADMVIEGILCEGCGVYMDDEYYDAPRKCSDCQPTKSKKKKNKKAGNKYGTKKAYT